MAIGCGLAIAAFAFGVTLGDGKEASPTLRAREAAAPLDVSQLAGERVVTGFAGRPSRTGSGG